MFIATFFICFSTIITLGFSWAAGDFLWAVFLIVAGAMIKFALTQ